MKWLVGIMAVITMAGIILSTLLASLAWSYYYKARSLSQRQQNVTLVPSRTVQHAFNDGTTFHCKINNTTSMVNAMTCISSDGSTEIDCTSDHLPAPFLDYFC